VATPYSPPSSALLSFNQPSSERSGACPGCEGLGEALTVAEDRLVAHPERSLHEGALALWTEKNYKYVNVQHETIEGLRSLEGLDPDVPWRKLPESARRLVLAGGVEVADRDRRSGRKLGKPRFFPGFVPAILDRYRKGTAASARLASFVREGPCPSCAGSRWSREARALRVAGRSIAELLAVPFAELESLCAPGGAFRRAVPAAAEPSVDQLRHLASSFAAVGLGHLSGERGMLTVSEGESRRLRLAGLLHARGRDLALLLDEPARGLHEQDVGVLVEALRELKRRHTVILNDHRFALAPAVDHVIELGPGAGDGGGRLVRQGPPAEVLQRGDDRPVRTRRQVSPDDPSLEVGGAWLHNLKGVDCRIPLGRLVSITGVSGSGKSSLVRGILLPGLGVELGDRIVLEGFSTLPGGRWTRFTGAGSVREVVAVEQRKPAPNRRSLVATFLGVADVLRRVYGASSEARELGLRAPDFGLNSGNGRCANCLGLGEVEDDAGFAPCPVCGGRCFDERVLTVRLEGLHVADLLARPITGLAEGPPSWAGEIEGLLQLLCDLDLGYLTLGRRLDRLSGGEVQRLRIAERLWRARAQGLLLILDEPSAGLHPRDVAQLLRVLDRIVGEGENTVLLVEHNLDLIRSSDWIVDLGPGGGPAGGRVVAQGTPTALARRATPTGKALAGRAEKTRSLAATRRGKGIAMSQPATAASARNARKWLKVLLGHEVRLPVDHPDGPELEGLAVVLGDVETKRQRPHELGGLDEELARLFLASSERPILEAQRADLLRAWRREPESELWIAPALTSMQIWGAGIPASVRRQISERLEQLHLDRHRRPSKLSAWRSTGARFVPETDSEEARSAVLDDALTLGGGYAELVAVRGSMLACIEGRRFDLPSGLVAPLRLTAPHLCRWHAAGRCSACHGAGKVPSFSLELLADERRPPTAEDFLRPAARAILKGVRRLVLIPFFRRLETEGLWDAKTPFNRLADSAQEVFLFGYWHRPGPGSFLKSPKADPQKTGSWLRWDGFYAHVRDQLDRSTDQRWAAKVRLSLEDRPCSVCDGSGLGTSSRLVSLEGRSLHEWVLESTIGELCRAVQGARFTSRRERRMRDRVVRGLGAMAQRFQAAPLRDPVEDPRLLRQGLKAVAAGFLRLPIVD
jgi:excinuclease ABC A subunit